MKILFCEVYQTYTATMTKRALESMGHTVITQIFPTPEDFHGDEQTIAAIERDIKKAAPDVVFSINFWGVIAEASHEKNVPYISWVYDSPMEIRDVTPLYYTTNRIFVFDRTLCTNYQRIGIANIFYLSLAADIDFWGKVHPWKKPIDVSLVGKLYDSPYGELRSAMGEYEGGFLDAVMMAQQKITQSYLIPELLDEHLLENINTSYEERGIKDFTLQKDELSYAMATELTHRDRLLLLRASTTVQNCQVSLFAWEVSPGDRNFLKGVSIEKSLDYRTEMPSVFMTSRINLNPILRANGDGIPLRALDVMSVGGFLLSSFREDFLNYFVPDKEVVLYSSVEEALEKIAFYMEYESLRKKIAQAGLERIKKDFTYSSRLSVMLDTI